VSCDTTALQRDVTVLVVVAFYIGIALTKCQKELQKAINLPSHSKQFVSHCKFDGNFEELQCQNSSGLCWCVDRYGKELSSTATNQTVECPLIGKQLGLLNLTLFNFPLCNVTSCINFMEERKVRSPI